MKIRLLLFSMLFMSVLFGFAKVPHIHIYRSDGVFNTIESGGAGEMHHLRSAGGSYRLYVPGEAEVPLNVIDSCVVRKTDIPQIYISVEKYPDATMLWDKELYLDATVRIEGNGYIDDLEEKDVKVKGRGNSSWQFAKKPMRLKFDKKTAIGNLRKAKNYVLLANYSDPSLMKNAMMMWLANSLGMPYANHAIPCNVYFNGSYAGSYLLTEKVGINSGSVDIDEETGILFELGTEYDEDYKFMSATYKLPVMVKDPDFDELEEEGWMPAADRLEIWQADWNAAERAVARKNGFDYFDLDSFVNYILIVNLLGNNEIGWPKSVYIYKTASGTDQKYIFGPTWDFDVCANAYILGDDGEIMESDSDVSLWLNLLFRALVNHNEFKAAYAERVKYFEENLFPDMLAYFDEFASLIEPSAKLNAMRWPEDNDYSWIYIPNTYDAAGHVSRFRRWLLARMAYISQGGGL